MSSSAVDTKSSKKYKVVKGGLEYPSNVIYGSWEPGGEYTLPLTLKNIKLTTQKLKFRLSSKLFTTPVFQQPLILCAGTTFTIPITFRPCVKKLCEELIEFQSSDGLIIDIPLRAVLPRPVLKLTELLKFDKCAVKSDISICFEMSNVGDLSAYFSWKIPCGFDISPKSGMVAPKQTLMLSALFSPEFAKVYTGTAVCTFSEYKLSNNSKDDSLSVCLMKLIGTGKYPHVSVQRYTKLPKNTCYKNVCATNSLEGNSNCVQDFRELTIDFGTVAVGCSDERWISVSNPSSVSCNFSVRPYRTGSDCTGFSLCHSPNHSNTLEPSASTKIKLVYSPLVLCDCQDIGYFMVQAEGGYGCSKIKCIGHSKGSKIIILNEKCFVNFGNVECGKTAVGKIFLTNQSDVAALFQLNIKSTSVFQCNVLTGELDGNSSISISVNFIPQNAIPYCRTISLVIQNQEPLFLTLLGTGYSEVQKPAQLHPRDISKYLVHAETGISWIPPQRLNEYIEEGIVETDSTNSVLKFTSMYKLPVSLPEKFSQDSSSYTKYLYSAGEMSTIPHITSDVEKIKFGYCSPSFSSDSKVVTICNHTSGEVSCVWMTGTLKNFVIMPPERTILPKKSASFTLFFKPDKAGRFYNTELECFSFYKDLSDSSRVNPCTVCPPWCSTLQLSGHTFIKDLEDSLSELSFEATNIVFPPALPGQPVYQTIVVRNPGNEQAHYCIPENEEKLFIMKPSYGILNSDFEIITVQMIPKEAKKYKIKTKCQLHSTSTTFSKKLNLIGFGEIPSLSLENDGQMFMKPTCIGTTTSQHCAVQNNSRLPLGFEWKHSNLTQSKVLHVEPSKGTILPNEIQEHVWYFTPMKPRAYEMRSALYSYVNIGTSGVTQKKHRTILDIFSFGTTGIIKCTPSKLDFGIMVTSSSKSRHILLSNSGPCDLHYMLSVKHTVATENEVELSPMEGVIYAQSTVQVKVTVRSFGNASHSCTIHYELISQIKGAKSHVLCDVEFSGTFPSLIIADIRGSGVASQVSKLNWWKMLSIDKINASLSDTPSATELQYAISSKHSLKHQIPIRTKAIVNCDFGAAPVNSEDCIIYCQLRNDGKVTTEWAFLMSTDLWLEPDYWADYGLAEKVEEDEMHVLNHELFMVSPKQGYLKPGDNVLITITYKHSHVGTHKLPVLFKINKGREIMLNWSGVTLEKGFPHLHISSKDFLFEAVPICTHSSPIQIFPLYNGGDTPVKYEVDVRPLLDLTETNYFMPIFECLQPVGKILPGKTLHLEFIFSPLEAVKYSVDVPIHLSTGITTIITLVGEGYDHNILKHTNEYKQNIPISGSISVPGYVACLSHDIINLGNIPQFAAVRRIVFISNTSSHTISYFWELESEKIIDKQVISVEPSSGHIQPGSTAACKVTFCSQFSSFNYSFDILCKIIDESEVSQYQVALHQWKKRRENKKQTLLITQANVKQQHNRSIPEDMSKDAISDLSPTECLSFDSEFHNNLDTLPPIRKSQIVFAEWKGRDLSKRTKKRPISKKIACIKPPTFPKPILLHLSVTARVISLLDYVKLHDNLDAHHIDQHALSIKGDRVSRPITQDDISFQKTILNQILKEVLEDSNFRQALCRIVEEPIPYFSQFSTHTIKLDELLSTAYIDPIQYKETKCHNGQEKGHLDTVCSELEQGHHRGKNSVMDDSELYSILESVMDNTLINIFNEANASEFILNQPLYNVAGEV